VERCCAWAEAEDVDAVIVFDGKAPDAPASEGCTVVGTGDETADDWLILHAEEYRPHWLVTSDRELRELAGGGAERIVGGGRFARELPS
jgi:hypothetical protein